MIRDKFFRSWRSILDARWRSILGADRKKNGMIEIGVTRCCDPCDSEKCDCCLKKNIVYVVQYVYVYIIEDGMQYWYGIGMSNEDGDEGCM